MADSFLARITPVEGPVDPGYGKPGGGVGGGGGKPELPIVLPPSPWPPDEGGSVELPIVIPPEVWDPTFPMPPIAITPPPNKPNPVPPGEVWPPLTPDTAGKLVAIIVLGKGISQVHWYHVPPPSVGGQPPVATPKGR